MSETLLTQSAVKMFGRELKGVQIDPRVAGGAAELGGNFFLRKQIVIREGATPRFAKIYAFSYEGAFYNLPRPALFLVHGDGHPIKAAGTYDDKTGKGPAVLEDSGIPARDFIFETDIRYWEYDKDDMSLRLDSFSGRLDEILIEDSLSPSSRSSMVSRSSMAARSSVVTDPDAGTRHRLR